MVYESLGIQVQHFDTKTGQNLDIQETFKNTVAEYLFPDTTFTLGTVYEGDKTTEQELQRFSDKSLQFANGKKFYFADDNTVRDQLFPTASDGAAYGSLPFTPSQQFTEVENTRVLVIDDESGENNAGLDPEYAKTLVGDCYCRIDNNLHQQVKGEENTPFQFRLGIKAQQESPVARIAKGTVSPMDLSRVGSGYDLILATSAFKGRKTEDEHKIIPGKYNLTVGLGLKSSAYYGTHSLGPQVLVNYPKGVALDIVPQVKKELEKLEKIASDPNAIAKDFIEQTDERYKYRVLDELGLDEDDLSGDDFDDVRSMINEQKNNDVIYKLLKNDIANHRQLLDHPKVVDALNNHLQSRYRELATGRFIKFKGGLLQPHHGLAKNEFCDPNLPDGAEVIVTRSPLVNSNGVITLTNRHLDDVKHLKGTVYMNAKTAADYLQGDFDGDRVAYELACKFPNLAAEVKEKHQEVNRYKDIEKLVKKAYEGSFESIALSAKDNQIGIIAIKVMKAVALEMELYNLPQEQVEQYINDFSDYMSGLWKKDKETGKDTLPKSLKGREPLVTEFGSLASSNQSNEEKLKVIKSFLHSRVDELAAQLQIAVDGPKSANRPDADVLSANDKLMGYRDIGWLKEYKDLDIYRKKVMLSNSYSPVDLMILEVNDDWEDNSLVERQTHQFEKLFNSEKVTPEDIKWAEDIRNEYNKLNSYAFRLKDEYGEAPGPRLTLNTNDGAVEIIHTLEATHPKVYDLENANIYFRKNEGKSHPDLKYVALAEVPGEKNNYGKPLFKRIGYVSKVSEKNNNLIQFESNQSTSKTVSGSVTLNPGVTANQVKAAFGQVSEYIQKTYGEIPDQEKQRKAAALWKVTHRRQTKIRNQQGQLDDSQRFNKAAAVFALFGDEINQQLTDLQFKSVKVAGVNTAYSQTGALPKNSVIPIIIKLEDNERSPQFGRRTVYVRGQQDDGKIAHIRLGYLPEDEAQLPINCLATATVTGDIQKVATATLENGQKISIEALKNYDYPTSLFDDTTVELEMTTTVPNGRKNPVVAVKLNRQLLGIVKKADRSILEQQHLTQGQKIKVQLNRGYYDNSMSLNIDPDQISYLPQHTTEKHLLQGKQPMKQDIRTFWSIDNNRARIVVIQANQQKFQNYFDGKINYQIIKDHQKARREANLGLVVFEVDKTEINKLDRAELEKVWGKPLSAFDYENKLTEIEEMPKQLPSESQENSAIKSNLIIQTSSTSSDSPPWITESESESNNLSEQSEKEDSLTVQLTTQQQQAFDKMRTWLSSPRDSDENNLFCLEGYAGTGKSFTVTHFVEAAKKDFPTLSIGYTGPTHEAVNVGRQLSKKLGIEFDDARTLHSLLKYLPGIDSKRNEERFQGRKLHPQQISELPDLIIVDEVSMVNEEMYDLLKELAQHSKKILLVGDNAQIRPVHEGRSKAFTDPAIKHRSQLTEVVRYSNQLGYLATALRTNQDTKKPLITSCPDETVVGQNQQDWTNNILTHFTSEEFNKDPNYFQIYAYTNARVDELNNQIRTARFGDDAPEYVEGEIIVADDNGKDIDETRTIFNGEELKVLNANKLPPSSDKNNFSTWLLTVESINGSDPPFDIKIIAQESQEAFKDKVKQLEKAWKMEKNRGLKSEKYKKAQQFKQSYNNISYNYARTYHKAQGKTKTKVAIDQQNINDSFNNRIEQTKIEASRQDLIQQMQELTYVAATRASSQLFVYNNKAALNLSQKPWYLPDEEWEKSQSDINTNQKSEMSSPNNLDKTSDVESDTNTNSKSDSFGIQVPPIPDEELEPVDEEDYFPSIEDLEDHYNHTDFAPDDVPLPEDEYDDQIANNNSQTSDENNNKPKPNTNNNRSSHNDHKPTKPTPKTPSLSIDQTVTLLENKSEVLPDDDNSKTQVENNQDEQVVKVSEISSDNIDKEQEKIKPKSKLKPKLIERKIENETSTSSPTELTLYCKGISEQNNGGWAYCIYEGDKIIKENYGGQENTYQNEMELTAIINSINKAIELNPKAEITIVTSQSVIDQLKQDSDNQNSLRSQLNEIANGRPISFNDEVKDNHPQLMAKVRSLAKKGLDSIKSTQKKPINISPQDLNESKDESNQQSVVETSSKNNVKLNLEENKQPDFIPLNEIPSNPEFNIKYLMEQQERTEKIAPIALEILKLQGNSSTQSYTGENHDINYDGHYLTITDKQGGVKMKAKFMGIDSSTHQQKWLSCLPANSPGLTSDDVQAFTSDSLRESIIMAKIQQEKANMIVA